MLRFHGILHNADLQWKTGLWVGKDTESDEHIILTELGAFKTRNLRRRPKSEQVAVELGKKVTGLPWSPKDNSKAADGDLFILPPGPLSRTSDATAETQTDN